MEKRAVKLVFMGFCLSIILCASCKQAPEKKVAIKVGAARVDQKKESSIIGSPIRPLTAITKSFNSFWEYFNAYAQLHQDYPTLDEKGNVIDKGVFLEKLNKGGYLPLVIYGRDAQNIFELAKIPNDAPKDISLTLMNYANRELIYYKMEGQSVPRFNFTDINGKVYTPENTKGKIVLFKCWFITCVACVQEMPALNRLVEKYKNRNDILFISLAMDHKAPLQQFLAKTRFDYATIPDQTEYMEKKLHVQMYPTHFIINKKGKIVKVPPNEMELERYLEKEITSPPPLLKKRNSGRL